MSLLDRIKGKSSFELLIMDLGDVLHTLKKNGVGATNTQDRYALTVMEERIKDLKKINEHKVDLSQVLSVFKCSIDVDPTKCSECHLFGICTETMDWSCTNPWKDK